MERGGDIEVPKREGLPTDDRVAERRPPDEPAVLAINAQARSGHGRARELVRLLRDAGVPVGEVIAPKKASTLPTKVGEAIAAGHRRIIIAGGDGTISGVARVLVDTDAVLGVVPLGTANDFARTLGIPSELPLAAKILASGAVALIDVGTANGVPFLNAASVGLSSALTRRMTAQLKKRWGKLAYPLLALATAREFHPFHLALETEGELLRPEPSPAKKLPGVDVLAFEALQVVIGNGRFHGGGQLVAPEATLEDQRLDLWALAAGSQASEAEPGRRLRRWRDLWALTGVAAGLRTGKQIDHPWVVHRSATTVTVRTDPPLEVNVDGELCGMTPVTFGVRPASLAVLVPPAAGH